MFVRSKKVKDGKYYQLVESYRPEGSKTPRQRVLIHLGRYDTVEAALEGLPKDIRKLRRQASKDRRMLGGKLAEEVEAEPMYRDTLARATSQEKQADDLESKLERLTALVARSD